MGVIVLCVDSESFQHPQLIGLDDVSFSSLPWLMVFTDAQTARDFVKSSSCIDEVWVVSSDNVSAINLAAALKHDNPQHCVYLVTFKRTGSLISCMRAAGINGSLSRQGFTARFALERQRRSGVQSETSLPTDAERDYGVAERAASVAPQESQASCDDERFMLKEPLSADVVAAYEPKNQSKLTPKHAQDMSDNKVDAKADVHEQVPSSQHTQVSTQTSSQPTAPETSSEMPYAESEQTRAASQSPTAAAHGTSQAVPKQAQTSDASSDANIVGDSETSDKSGGASPIEEKRQKRGSAFVLSIVSGSGGVGRSTVAALSAFCAQQRGYRTLLLDCDLQFGDLHYFMGIDSPVRVEDVLNDPLALQSLEDRGDSPALVASLGHLEDAETLARMLPQVIDILSENFDVIVVNTGASWAEQHAVILECSSCALFLVDQRASSVRSCRRALDLCKRCGIASGAFAYAVNRCCRGALLTSVDVSCALQGVHVFELKDGGNIVEELLGAGMAFELVRERNDLCESIENMLDEVLPLDRLNNVAMPRDGQRTGRRHGGGSARKMRRSARNRGRGQTSSGQGRSCDTGQLHEDCSEFMGAREMMRS